MNAEPPRDSLDTASVGEADRRLFFESIDTIERRSFAARVAEFTGDPIDKVLRFLPTMVSDTLRDAVNGAMLECLELALASLDSGSTAPHPLVPSLLTGVTGGLGGFFGMLALPIELPVTTAIILRSIAAIAGEEGEDLDQLEARLACLEVFALGGGSSHANRDIGYYTTRTVMARMMTDVMCLVSGRGACDVGAPVVLRLVSEITTRMGYVVLEKVGATTIPVVGAVGGAAVNVMFTKHFLGVARAHFVIRRLERRHGFEVLRALYAARPVAN